MIFSNRSNYMLKYQKAKAKLVEYGIPQDKYPDFPLNSNELSYPVIFILSRYAESVIEGNDTDRDEFSHHLVEASQYFDAAVGSRDRAVYDSDFLLSGSAAYFLSDDFGSAKVLCSELFKRNGLQVNVPQYILAMTLGYLLTGRKFEIIGDTLKEQEICRSLLAYFTAGECYNRLIELLSDYREEIYQKDIPLEIIYVDIMYAIILVALSKSSWLLLPKYSELDLALWAGFLSKPQAPKILWPAQQLIGEKGLLTGKNAIVQLPTGAGKTKSIELIIRSAFASGRTCTAIIVAPLRALCNEIANDMIDAFGDEFMVNQFSDVLEDDFDFETPPEFKCRVLICTPEKLIYIIHHQVDFLDDIGLYIFDEGHMFDDGSRGATYEFLISEIRNCISTSNQVVLLSAVLSNADQIMKWMFDNSGVLASDPKIKATPKSIGFVSKAQQIHYFTGSFRQEDFYIPNSIDVVPLQKYPREKRLRQFPDLTNSTDIAIYCAIRLCKNGGAAIFASQTRSVPKAIQSIIEISKRGYDVSGISKQCNRNEMEKISKLIAEYYGSEHIYVEGCQLGVVPHYASLPNGLRISIEDAFRNNLLRLVICTTTLAQGVNIPIKYLFVTSCIVAGKMMQVRRFQNLIGRTARSGMFTEGSIIVTDPKIYDNRRDTSNGGWAKWDNYTRLFDAGATEPCGSSILELVQGITLSYNTTISGFDVAQYIVDHYNEPDCLEQYSLKLKKLYPSYAAGIDAAIEIRKSTLLSVENHLCFIFSANEERTDMLAFASEICKETLAYFMANSQEKEWLLKLFCAAANKITTIDGSRVQIYARTMIGIDLSMQIEKWIEKVQLTSIQYSSSQLIEMLVDFFLETHTVKKGLDSLFEICKMWIEGYSLYDISEKTSLKIPDIEDACSKTISYELSFFIGNIIDVIDTSQNIRINPIPDLLLLQTRTKYGVKTETDVSICEKVFNDRFLAGLITKELGSETIASGGIKDSVRAHMESILNLLEPYPQYFTKRIIRVCKD